MIRNYLNHVFIALLLVCSSSVLAENNESYPVINSNEVLSSDYLSSTYHRVESIDINNDYYHFIVESDIGRYDIYSLALFKKRVNEIKTVARAINLYEQQNNEFSDELRSQLTISADSAVDLLTRPLDSASNFAGQIAGNLNATLEGEDAFVHQSNKKNSYEPKDLTTATHKRNIAFQLGLDVYTNNSRAQTFLNTVAHARSAGRVSAGVGLTNDVVKSGEMDLKIKYLIKNKTLAELNFHNSEWLARIGIKESLIKQFIAHPVLSPTNKTVITAYLVKMEKVSRLDNFIELVLTTNNELHAFLYERLSNLMWRYHNEIEKISTFSNYKGQAAAITNSRKIVFFDMADLLIWSEAKQDRYEVAAKHAKSSGYKAWEVVSPGSVSQLANQKMDELLFKQQRLSSY
jgi:hypothetical protein